MRHHLVELAEHDSADRAEERNAPAPPTNVQATQAQDRVGEEGHKHREVQRDLRSDDGLLHLHVAQEVPVERLVEGARNVCADVLGEDERDEGHGARLGKLCLKPVQRHDVLLEDRAVAIVHQTHEVNTNDDCGENAAVHDGALPHPAEHDGLLLGAWPHLEDGLVARLHTQGDGRRQIGHKDQEEDLQRRAHHGHVRNDAHEDLQDLGNVNGHDEGHKLLDACVNRPALLDGGNNRAEVVVGEDHLCCTFGDLRALDPHCDADVRLVQRGRVVHAVARHGAHEALALEGLHDLDLVLGLGACEALRLRRQRIDLCLADVITLGPERATVHGVVVAVIRREDAHVLGNGDGGLEIIAGDHDHTDARAMG
mmetsp:Transcript_24496/g.67316  ORF Transcript_24496/g.67316 Transcript_24496/m.67316 type:complete len:369 (-) Transcript_24496:1957-3063(-)